MTSRNQRIASQLEDGPLSHPVSRLSGTVVVALATMWGFTYVAIDIATRELSSLMIAASRSLAALALLIALRPRLAPAVMRIARARPWEILLLGTLQVSIPFWSMAIVLEYVPAGTAAVLGTTSPVIVALVAPLVDDSERLRRLQWTGVLVALAGVGVTSGITPSDPGRPLSLAVQLAASASFAAATLLAKRRFADDSPSELSTATLLVGAIVLLPGAVATWPQAPLSPIVIAAMVELVVIGTVLAYVVFFAAIKRGAGSALRPIYLSPGIAIVVGSLWFGDPITASLVGGFALTVMGVAATMSRPGIAVESSTGASSIAPGPVMRLRDSSSRWLRDAGREFDARHMALNRDFEPDLPARNAPAESWTIQEECSFAAGFYNSLYTSITTSMLRRFGHSKTYEVHQKLLRHHQVHYFLDGLKKLRLDRDASDAIRCARYHCYSNALGGLQMRFAVESEKKAWLFYYPQPSGNPWPGPGLAMHTEDNMLVDYWGWHSNNGALLGNEGLIYVATHFVANNDPFDGGYFLDTGAPVPPGERVRVSVREELPPESAFEATRLDPAEWPEARKAKAFRRYGVTWAADRAWSSIHHLGEEGAAAVTHGLCITTFQWLPRLLAAYGHTTRGGGDAIDEFALVAAGVHRMGGMESECTRNGDALSVEFERGLFDFVASEPTADDWRHIDDALTNAWSSIAGHFDRRLAVQVSDNGRRWAVTCTGNAGA